MSAAKPTTPWGRAKPCPLCAGNGHAGYQLVFDPGTGLTEQVDCWFCGGHGRLIDHVEAPDD